MKANFGHQWPAWHNGKFCQVKDLHIPINDLGFLRSQAVYEVLAIRHNRLMAFEQHMQRFLEGCRHYFIGLNYQSQDILDVITNFNDKLKTNFQVWVIATRGESASHTFSDMLRAESQLMVFALPWSDVNQGNPIRCAIAKKVRRIPDGSINQCYKNFARHDFTVAQIETQIKGYDSALLLDHSDCITEGPQFSVAMIKNQKVLSPSRNRLSGITMQIVQNLCQLNDTGFEYTDITEQLLKSADDVFATTTAGGIIPIACIDDVEFMVSDLQSKIKQWYQQSWMQNRFCIDI